MQSNEAIRNIKAQELILHAQEAPHIQKWHPACAGSAAYTKMASCMPRGAFEKRGGEFVHLIRQG